MELNQLPAHSRVWIYQADRVLNDADESQIRAVMEAFMQEWTAHGRKLNAGYELYHRRFLVIAVDEAQAKATGCSIDASVAVVKELGSQLGIDFFDRKLTAYYSGDSIEVKPLHEFWALRKAHVLSDDTLVFNNLVADLEAFRSSWVLPFGKSWHAEMFR